MITPDDNHQHSDIFSRPAEKRGSSAGVLQRIEEMSMQSGKQLLVHMFSATGDLFYELSKRATSNNEQNLYFESMREIRIKKDALNTRFLALIEESFDKLSHPLAYKQNVPSDQT